ncbi:TIGR03862 family flavoprotein [Sedimentitalea sp. JM2-8]|uniref:TIGR03862 family flavoprotein n=1 Tax=Sedimentitalea xiamensis TaxID=3050037 RepID=A0ABT7F911_9RHOB|nr:TIGR03862 family flavoprotein [Sedimentitalea xiamensis]MDK3071587.1 TIGR03862 family flavoprotein [Sedimentitalea xiamensis]
MSRAVVIGGGPAGLMAAEELGRAGCSVLLADAKPSFGRKFLMAGKSGLNLTKAEPQERFLAAYEDAAPWLAPMLAEFSAEAVQDWARGLGQNLFTGSTGRVFPVAMKASPLLRAWLARLDGFGVTRRSRWRWTGWDSQGELLFDTPDGQRSLSADVTVLALGGASWARLGSDGAWSGLLAARGIDIAPFQPANAALDIAWSDHMTAVLGEPLKGVALSAGSLRSRGEAVISRRGLEGGGIYAISRAVRQGAVPMIDLMPDLPVAEIARRLARPRGKSSWSNHLRRALNLGPVHTALLQEFGRPLPTDAVALAALVKALPIRHAGLRPMDEAISTAGGVRRAALTDDLMLRAFPGVFCAGEMLDWEAPTGGYLLTACLATGKRAGRAAAAYAQTR